MEMGYIIILLCFGLLVFFSFLSKSILSNNGFKVKPFQISISELSKLFKLASMSITSGKKIVFYLIGVFEILSFAGIIIGSGLFLFSRDKCKSDDDFKNNQYDYLIVAKFLDSTEHSYPTLVLQDHEGHKFSNIDLLHDQSGLFNFLSAGDSIKKRTGTDSVIVINNKIDTTYVADFGCDRN